MPPDGAPAFAARAVLAVAGAVLLFRAWTSVCFFPLAEWNNVRLAPTFMLAAGLSPYPPADAGPVTTWIYGPVTLLWNLPALAARDSSSALLIAGALTLALALVPALVSVCDCSRDAVLPAGGVTAAILLCLALWPNTSLQYIQSDNAALACGLGSNVLLGAARRGRRSAWALAAGLAALAAWSKQTAVALVAAQTVWLAATAGFRTAWRYGLLCGTAGAILGATFAACFGVDGLWWNLVRIPAALPLASDLAERSAVMAPQLLLCVGLPAAGIAAGWRIVWRRDSAWLLPVLSWLALLPFAMVSLYRIGGAPNSLNGALYLLPPAAVAAVAGLSRHGSRGLAWAGLAAIAIALQQLACAPLLPLRPLDRHLVEADALVRSAPGHVYFPWHPLVTYFAEHRFDHVEDGLSTRSVAGVPVPEEVLRRHLPPAWTGTALPGWRERDPSLVRSLQPSDARLALFGFWSLYAWPCESASSSASSP